MDQMTKCIHYNLSHVYDAARAKESAIFPLQMQFEYVLEQRASDWKGQAIKKPSIKPPIKLKLPAKHQTLDGAAREREKVELAPLNPGN